MSPTARHPRGFTLLETVMAAVIGAVLVMIIVGLMMAAERTDRVLAARSEQSGDLQRARLVMQRLSMNFLMSNKLPPRKEPETPPPAADVSKSSTRPSRREPDRATMPLTPRFILDADPRYGNIKMSKGEAEGDTFAVQRFEVVLTDSPVPTTERDAWSFVRSGVPMRRADREKRARDAAAAKGASREDDATGAATLQAAIFAEEAQGMVRAVRGAIEFWPQTSRTAQSRLDDLKRSTGEITQAPVLWEMWWVPLPPRGDTAEDEPTPEQVAAVGDPFLIASNIRYARVTAYDDREKKVRMAVARRQELPAYIEMELETGAGLKAHWMFETDGAVGPEVPPRVSAEDAAAVAAKAASGATGSTAAGSAGIKKADPATKPGTKGVNK